MSSRGLCTTIRCAPLEITVPWLCPSRKKFLALPLFQWNTNTGYALLKGVIGMTLSDFKRLCEIFNDTKRCTVSLQQPSLFRFPRGVGWYVHILGIFVAVSVSLNAATVLFVTVPICDTDQFPAL